MTGFWRQRSFWFGLLVSGGALWFLLRSIDYGKLAASFAAMNWWLLLPAVLLTFASFFGRAVRWQVLLAPARRIGVWPLYRATLVGYMANNLLPARLGELVRAHVLASREELPTSGVLATLVVDRLYDAFTVLVVLVLALATVHLPAGMEQVQHRMVQGGMTTAGVFLVFLAMLVILKRGGNQARILLGLLGKPLPLHWRERLDRLVEQFLHGLQLWLGWRDLFYLLLSSAGIWILAIWPIDLVLRAFGLQLPASAALMIMVFLVFAIMVPAAPGYIGTYHAACQYGLMVFGVDREQALSIAIVMHAIGFFPVIAAGFYCLWHDRISFGALVATEQPVREGEG